MRHALSLEQDIARLEGMHHLNVPAVAYPSKAWLSTNPTDDETREALERLVIAYNPGNDMR